MALAIILNSMYSLRAGVSRRIQYGRLSTNEDYQMIENSFGNNDDVHCVLIMIAIGVIAINAYLTQLTTSGIVR